MSAIVVALSSLVGGVLGVLLTHVFSIKRKQRDELAEFRLKAYVDFINAASRLVSARRVGRTADEIEELAALNDAKIRICICADPKVVEALVKFWKYGGTLEREREILAFTRLCLQIRESLGNSRNDIVHMEISNTLFKLQPSAYSYRAGNHEDISSLEY